MTEWTKCTSNTLLPGSYVPIMTLNSLRDPYYHVHVYIGIAKSIYAILNVFQILKWYIELGLGPKDGINNSSLWVLASATSNPCGFAGSPPSHLPWVEKKNPTVVG